MTIASPISSMLRTVMARRFWWYSGGFVAVLAVSSVAVHPSGRVKRSESQPVMPDSLQIPSQVASMLKRSCMDCHSNQTVWRWYSYVAPMSWLVERDVRRGRDEMNFSTWDQYDFGRKEELLADIASAVKNQEMPLPQYTLVHQDAKLSDADRDVLYGWARGERRRLKPMARKNIAATGISHYRDR
jgi:Haem-binding domain